MTTNSTSIESLNVPMSAEEMRMLCNVILPSIRKNGAYSTPTISASVAIKERDDLIAALREIVQTQIGSIRALQESIQLLLGHRRSADLGLHAMFEAQYTSLIEKIDMQLVDFAKIHAEIQGASRA